MSADLDPEQQLLVDNATEITESYGETYFREKRLANETPSEYLEDIAEAGYFGITLPREYGGEGLGMLDLVHVIEAIGAAGGWDIVGRFTLNTVFGGMVLAEYGTEAQKEEYLPKLATGEANWALGVTESSAGSNMLRTQTFAERDGDEFIINGEKAFNSGVGSADGYTFLARTTEFEEVSNRSDGLTVFLIDPADPAVEYEEVELDIYWPAGENTYTVHIDNLRVDESRVIGEVDEGFDPIFEVLNPERVSVGAEHIARGRWALEQAVDRAKSREVWGEPIGAHQGVQHPLADAYASVETASTMVKRAAKAFDNRQDNIGELANIAHYKAGEAGFGAADVAVETFGGASSVADYGIAAVWSLARHQQIAPITDNMKLNYIANNVLGLPRSYGT